MKTDCQYIRRSTLVAVTALLGCATSPYRYGTDRSCDQLPTPADVRVVYGAPNAHLDRAARIAHTPAHFVGRLLQRPPRIVSPVTIDRAATYLEKNGLGDVEVSVEGYDPAREWRRLRENDSIAAPLRYTFGAMSVVGYTLLPGRIFGGNRYNPYTDTLNLYTESPASALYEAAFAKRLRERSLPNVQVVVHTLPFVSLPSCMGQVGEVVGYARAENDWDLERSSYQELYPRVGSQITSPGIVLMPVFWQGAVVGLSGGAAGHVAGWTMISRREAERAKASH